ncbi:MAG TPA: phosphoribosylformylglycinamidine cyclo-ligase [Terrimicrobium sp.]
MKTKKTNAYARAGVDVELGNTLKRGIQSIVRSTHGPEVLGKIGGFGGLFRANFKAMKQPVLVSSVDGVGTKLKVAFAMGRHDTVGQDLVNHCINDIAVLGARPLFFLDYIAAGKLEPAVFKQLLGGLAKACKAARCALIGGETAQMPGMYREDEYDLAGTIVGVVDRPKMLDGSLVRPGDVLVGLLSDGLHTNGFSLARRVLFEDMSLKTSSRLPELRLTIGEELLRVHRNYQPLISSLPAGLVHAASHITGGGLTDNLPRVLPNGCQANIRRGSWRVPPIFQIIQRAASVSPAEMFNVFNMGIGMVLIVPKKRAAEAARRTRGRVIGEIVEGAKTVTLV